MFSRWHSSIRICRNFSARSTPFSRATFFTYTSSMVSVLRWSYQHTVCCTNATSHSLSYFLAWGSFLPSYDPKSLSSHCIDIRYSHCLAALEPHWGCTTKILKTVTFCTRTRCWKYHVKEQLNAHVLVPTACSNTVCTANFWKISVRWTTINPMCDGCSASLYDEYLSSMVHTF